MKQKTISIEPKPRGFHIVTREIEQALTDLLENQTGICHLFIKHTSASLTLNENADPDVISDMNMSLNKLVPESWPYRHTAEGPDDMPAHVKSSLMGSSLMIPVTEGRLNLGTWQGIYLGEHRDHGGSRKIICTLLS